MSEYEIELNEDGVYPTLQEMSNGQLWTVGFNLRYGIWKLPGGAGHKWPTRDELHAEQKSRGGWVTACEVCWEWFPMQLEDAHVCPGYEVSDFQTPGGRY